MYTSEDDDDEEGSRGGEQPREFPSGLYEVNEDELILAIGGSGGGGSPSHRVNAGVGAYGSSANAGGGHRSGRHSMVDQTPQPHHTVLGLTSGALHTFIIF